MRHATRLSRRFARRAFGAVVIGVIGALWLAASTTAEAAQPDQVGNGKKVPEVPIAALLPAASGLIGGGYYLVHRLRGRRPDDR